MCTMLKESAYLSRICGKLEGTKKREKPMLMLLGKSSRVYYAAFKEPRNECASEIVSIESSLTRSSASNTVKPHYRWKADRVRSQVFAYFPSILNRINLKLRVILCRIIGRRRVGNGPCKRVRSIRPLTLWLIISNAFFFFFLPISLSQSLCSMSRILISKLILFVQRK